VPDMGRGIDVINGGGDVKSVFQVILGSFTMLLYAFGRLASPYRQKVVD
jgi:hypothetical protein